MESLDQAEKVDLLARGRVSTRQPQIQVSTLALASNRGQVHRMHEDPGTSELRWVQFDLTQMPRIPHDNLKQYVSTWWQQHRETYKLPDFNDLYPMPVAERHLSSELVSLSFGQRREGRIVKDAFVDFVFRKVGDNVLTLREVVNQTTNRPVNSAATLLDWTQVKQRLAITGASLLTTEDLWLIPDNEDESLAKARRFTFRYDQQRFSWTFAGDEGEVVEAYEHRLTMRDQVRARVFERSYLDDNPWSEPLAFAELLGSGSTGVMSADGLVPAGLWPSQVRLTSDRAKVYEGEASQPKLLSLEEKQGRAWLVNPSDHDSALNAYTSIQRINRFTRRFLTDDDTPFLSRSVEVRVNMEGECNAYYTTGTARITLYEAGGGCANLAMINDVIYHEWGHGLDDHTGRQPGVQDGAFSEGIADVVAAYYTGDPEIGRGFVQDAEYGIRSLENDRFYPADIGQVHREGGIIGGAFWDLRQALMERYGELEGQEKAGHLFFRHLLTADTYHDSYQAVLRLDDDDGNPATLSPNYCLINEIFAKRGLADPEYCQDQAARSYESTAIDEDLFLALADTGETHTGLVASSAYATDMVICKGRRKVCLSGEAPRVHMERVTGTADRRFFTYSGSFSLKPLDLVTIIAKNENDRLIGSRVVKIVSK
jgi:hypothetical protein